MEALDEELKGYVMPLHTLMRWLHMKHDSMFVSNSLLEIILTIEHMSLVLSPKQPKHTWKIILIHSHNTHSMKLFISIGEALE